MMISDYLLIKLYGAVLYLDTLHLRSSLQPQFSGVRQSRKEKTAIAMEYTTYHLDAGMTY